jgi:hypothetical protein
MTTRCCGLSVLLIAAGLAGPAQAQAQVRLDWKFKKGETFYVRTVSVADQEMAVLLPRAGHRQSLHAAQLIGLASAGTANALLASDTREQRVVKRKLRQTTELAVKVLDTKSDGSVVLELSFRQLELDFPGSTPTEVARRLQNVPFRLTLGSDREIQKVEGYDELIRKVAGEDPNLKAGAMAGGVAVAAAPVSDENAPLRRLARAVLSRMALARSLRDIFGFLPSREVRDGADWKHSFPEAYGPLGTCTRATTYRYEGRESLDELRVDKITFTTDVELRVRKPRDEGYGVRILRADVRTVKGNGTITFDAVKGRLIKSEGTLTLKGPLVLSVDGHRLDTGVRQKYDVTTEVSDKPFSEPQK